MREKTSSYFRWITIGLFLTLAIVQFSYVWSGYAREQLHNLTNYAPTIERSEILVVGANDARYLRFLDLYLPKNASIVGAPVRKFGLRYHMNWFLFPRITNIACADGLSDACMQQINDPTTVVMAVGDFPPNQVIPGKVFIPYTSVRSNDLRGLYVPEGMAAKLTVPDPSEYTNPPVRSPRLLILDLLILGSLFVLGAFILCLILASPSWLDYLSLSLPLAFSVLTWVIFITSWLGIPITRTSIGITLAILLFISVIANRYWNHKWFSIPQIKLSANGTGITRYWLIISLALLLVALFGLAVFIAIGRSYSAFDEIVNWGLKGYAMAAFGSVQAGAVYGGHILSYPLNIPLSIALFRILDGDLIPGSKMIFPLLAAALFIQIYVFLRRHRVDAGLALAGGLFICTVPSLFTHSTLAYANLPFTAYLLMAIFWTIDGLLEGHRRWVLLGGVLFAAASWTRPEGIGFSIIFLLGIYIFASIRQKTHPKMLDLLCSLAPMLLPILWMILVGSRNMSEDQIGRDLSLFLAQAAKGNLSLWAILAILQFAQGYFFAPKDGAGFILPLGVLLILAGLLLAYHRRNWTAQLTLLLAALAALIPAAMFYLAAPGQGDYVGFLRQSFARAYFPALILLMVSALLLFAPIKGGLAPEMDSDEKSERSVEINS